MAKLEAQMAKLLAAPAPSPPVGGGTPGEAAPPEVVADGQNNLALNAAGGDIVFATASESSLDYSPGCAGLTCCARTAARRLQ